MKDYYSILGVSRHTDSAELKRAYRRLAIKYHPDKNPDPSVENLFKDIVEAYDTLSDPHKKFFYDQQYFVYYKEQEALPGEKPHRDPAYRRKPNNYRPVHKPTSRELMHTYVDYVKWMTYFAFFVTCVLLIDYILPYRVHDEQIINVYAVEAVRGKSRAMQYLYDVIFTGSGKEIRVYNQHARYFNDELSLKLVTTPILSTPMQLMNEKYTISVPLGYIYNSGIALIPLTLFIISGMGILFRHKKEFLFNASIASGLLNMLVLYFIFTI
jgi:curved DNA-binding protein CbpA